jgi:hypothetical protein
MSEIKHSSSNHFDVNGHDVVKQRKVLEDGEVLRRTLVDGQVAVPWHQPGSLAPNAAPAAPAMPGDVNAAAAPALAAPPAGGIPALPGGAGVPAAAPPAAAPVGGGAPAAAGGSFSSTGDPHDVGTNGATFDNQNTGTFQAISTDGTFGIRQTQTDAASVPGMEQYAGAKLNTDVRIKTSAGNFMNFNATTQTLKVNGQDTPLPTAGQTIPLADGATLVGNADGTMTMTSSSGDVVNITNHQGQGPNGTGGYIDFTGTPSANRPPDSVHGLLGANAGNLPLDTYQKTPGSAW